MDYTPKDYDQLYNDDERNAVASIAWADWLICAAVGVLLALFAGCDSQAALATHESVMAAYEKKEALMGQPCVYVAQCTRIEYECDPRQRRCISSADLSQRNK